MANFNKVILMGHLTRDPEQKTLPGGTTACDMGLAVNRRWRDAQGQTHEEVLFIDGTAFGKRADAITGYFKKGQPIHIEGHLKLDMWQAEDGTKRQKIRFIVEQFTFVAAATTGPKKPNAKAANGKDPQAAKRNGRAKRPALPADEATAVEANAGPEEEIPF